MAPRPRIALDCRLLHWPGVGRYLRELAAGLVAAAPDLDFYWLCSRETHDVLPAGERVCAVAVRSAPFGVAEQLELPVLLASLGIDLLHAPVSHHVPLVSPRLVVTAHDLAVRHFPEFLPSALRRSYYALMNAVAMRRARRVIAVSEFTRDDVLAAWPAAAGKVLAVLNGVSQQFRPIRDVAVRELARKHLDLPERYVLYLGTWKRHKNLPRLLQAYGQLAPELRRRFPLVVVAPPDPRYPEVEASARAAGIAGDVRWLSHVPEAELPALYSLAHCVVLPSLYEGFGLPVAEGFACGTPALVARAGSLPEIGGDACLTCDPRDVGSIARGLARLLGDEALRAELAEKALVRARAFSWQRAATRVAEIYREVLAS